MKLPSRNLCDYWAEWLGKSTLLQNLVYLIKPLSGYSIIERCPIPTEHNITLRYIAYVPQFHAVNRYFHISVKCFIKQR